MEQLECMSNAGMLEDDNLTFLRIRGIAKQDLRIRMFKELILTYTTKCQMEYIENQFYNDYDMFYRFNDDIVDENTEALTLTRLYEDCHKLLNDDDVVFYFHSKGITSYISNVGPGLIKEHRIRHYWRNTLNHYMMTRWRDCVKALETHDVVGLQCIEEPYKHLSGNFWWARASYIKTLPHPIDPDWNDRFIGMQNNSKTLMYKRSRDEMWLCSNPNVRVHGMIDPSIKDLHSSLTPLYKLESMESKL